MSWAWKSCWAAGRTPATGSTPSSRYRRRPALPREGISRERRVSRRYSRGTRPRPVSEPRIPTSAGPGAGGEHPRKSFESTPGNGRPSAQPSSGKQPRRRVGVHRGGARRPVVIPDVAGNEELAVCTSSQGAAPTRSASRRHHRCRRGGLRSGRLSLDTIWLPGLSAATAGGGRFRRQLAPAPKIDEIDALLLQRPALPRPAMPSDDSGPRPVE